MGGKREDSRALESRGSQETKQQCPWVGGGRGGRSGALVRDAHGSQGDRGRGVGVDSDPHALQPCDGMTAFLPE